MLLPEARAEHHRTRVHVTLLRVAAAERDQLLALRAGMLKALLAQLRVLDDVLHLATCSAAAVGVAALARVLQQVHATLDRLGARVARVGRLGSVHAQKHADLLRGMRVLAFVEPVCAQVEVLKCAH